MSKDLASVFCFCKLDVCQNDWGRPRKKRSRMLQRTQIHIPEASVVAVRKINQDLTEDMDKGEEEVRNGDFDSFLVWP